ncbi:MAG TPA: hypothetical protein VIW22_06865 [Nitrososphaerales archaeon]
MLRNIYFFDVMVQGVSNGTARVTITHVSVKPGTQMQYWNGKSWTDVANLSVRGHAISGDIPVRALKGTAIVIGTK